MGITICPSSHAVLWMQKSFAVKAGNVSSIIDLRLWKQVKNQDEVNEKVKVGFLWR